jgi:3-methyladenine DNA glycosylase AlkD
MARSRVPSPSPPPLAEILRALEALASPRYLANLTRVGITATHALGVSMADLQKLARQVGRDHDTAAALWATGIYEARLLAAYVDEPARVTKAQMNRWCADFDNWGVCDTLCFALFDRTPHAWSRIDTWAVARPEFVRRAAFALMASLAVHDKASPDAPFVDRLPLIEAAASDERDLVRKGVSWALRTTGRRNASLHAAALALGRRLAASDDAGSRWVGRDVVRELTGPIVARHLQRRAAKKR